MSEKIKHTWQLSRAETARLLHQLAQALESGADAVEGYEIPLAAEGEYKIRIKLEKDTLLDVTFTGKAAQAGIAENAGDPPPSVGTMTFSAAKRIMQTSFKAVSGSLNRGKLPTPESMDDFLSGSLGMCNGQHDAAYATFAELCRKLRISYDAADLTAVTGIVQEMILAKKDCHKRLA